MNTGKNQSIELGIKLSTDRAIKVLYRLMKMHPAYGPSTAVAAKDIIDQLEIALEEDGDSDNLRGAVAYMISETLQQIPFVADLAN